MKRYFLGMGEQYHRKFGDAYEIVSDHNQELMEYFHATCEKHGMLHDVQSCFQYMREFPERYEQMTLF
ncbi:MAG: hypothetical protein IJV50_08785 [Lachnospiraceae bacterium]|nr:hypothetical protein [Lachnospiraceae bacterium]